MLLMPLISGSCLFCPNLVDGISQQSLKAKYVLYFMFWPQFKSTLANYNNLTKMSNWIPE